jgi:hypothetical protein
MTLQAPSKTVLDRYALKIVQGNAMSGSINLIWTMSPFHRFAKFASLLKQNMGGLYREIDMATAGFFESYKSGWAN